MRIQKHLANEGIISRREAERYIARGKVTVNEIVVTNPATQIDPTKDKIELTQKPEPIQAILYYKPRGVNSDKANENNIFEMLPQYKDFHNAGRLDKESEGVIILTNSGLLTSIITSEKHLIEKEYVVDVREILRPTNIKALSSPMRLEHGTTLPAIAKKISDYTFSIILVEGKNHQIRRMANKVHLTIENLKRVRIGNLKLGNLKPGEFRELEKSEINDILMLKISKKFKSFN